MKSSKARKKRQRGVGVDTSATPVRRAKHLGRDYAPQALLVLGMHRNGTSALTRVFSLLGADLPKNLLGSNFSNPAGHWESYDFLAIHDDLLSSAGSSWDDWRAFNPDWQASPVAETFKQKLLSQLQIDFGESRFFVVKDPRICRFVPVWLDVLDRFGADTRVVIPLRNPIEVAASLKQRDGFLLSKSYLLWLRHVLDAERATRNIPRAVVTYHALVEDWRGVVATIADRTKLHWPRRSDQAELEIDRFLVEGLRHHVHDPSQLGVRADIVDWVKGAYQALSEMAAGGENKVHRERLDKIFAEFNKASAAFGLVLAGEAEQNTEKQKEIARLSEELKLKQTLVAERESAREQALKSLEEQNRERQRLADELNAAQTTLAERESAREQALKGLEEQNRERQRLADELNATQAAREQTQQSLEEQNRERQRLADELNATQTTLAERENAREQALQSLEEQNRERQRLADELNTTQATLAEHDQERDRLAAGLDEAKATAVRTEHEAVKLSSELNVARTAVQQHNEEIARLSREIEAARRFLRDSQTETQYLAGELDGVHQKFELRGQQIGELSAELQLANARSAQVEMDLARLNAELSDTRRRVSERESSIAALEHDLNSARALLDDLRATIRQVSRHLDAASQPAREGPANPWRALAGRFWRPKGRAKDVPQWEFNLIRDSKVFDSQWYLAQHPDVAAAGLDPLWHYIRYGAKERRDPHPLFDSEWYLSQVSDFAELNLTPLGHYVSIGVAKGLDPHPLFDTSWYLENNLDVAATHLNPLHHYFAYGAKEGRDPHPLFDTDQYAATHPDIATSGINPLVHYLNAGPSAGAISFDEIKRRLRAEAANKQRNLLDSETKKQIGLKPEASALILTEGATSQYFAYNALKDSGLFDSNYYLQKYPHVAAAKIEPLKHFMMQGALEGRDPNPWFFSKWYTWQYPDIARIDNPLMHYFLHGAEEGRDPSPWFNTVKYFLSHPGLAEAKINPLAHYIASGTAGIPDSLQSRLVLQNNADRVVKSPELTDLIDFPPRELSPTETIYNPSSLDIHWIIPDFDQGGGGHQTIFRTVRLLEQFGHRCTIWITRPYANRHERSARETAIRHYQTVKAEIKFLTSEFFSQGGDALICTSWETVIFGMHATGFKDRFYFVQDYEPAFFATGSHSLAAEWTYQNDIACICASPWLAEKIEKMYGRWTRANWLAADLAVYRPHDGPRSPADVPRIAFYARRHTERRAVDLGLLALEYLATKGVKFHVEFFGMEKLDIGPSPYSFTDNGILSESELVSLYQRSDVGIVFSSTNYSLVPQEMMASGLAVLELDGDSTRRIYPKEIVTLAGPHPIDMAGKLASLLEDPDRRAAQANAALTWVRQFSWEKFARVVESAALERLQAKGFSPAAKISAPFIAEKTPRASVVIPTYNGGEVFRKAIRAVQAQHTPWPFEIIIIDSSSNDGTAEFAAKLEGVVFRSIPKHEFQHGRTRNLGIEMASGEYVALLTHDAQPFNDSWLYNMITVMDKYPRAAGAFGRHVTYPDASPFLKRDMTNHFAAFDAHPLAVSKYTNFKNWVSGETGWRQMLYFYSDNNSCLRKSVWNTIPYPNVEYGEDQVWAARIIEAGYEKLYVPSATVFHSHNYSPDELFETSRQQGRFFKKYFGYDCAPGEDLLDRQIADMNARDEQWASVNGIGEKLIANQRKLNAAKLRGLWTGMTSAAYIGYERDPMADAAE